MSCCSTGATQLTSSLAWCTSQDLTRSRIFLTPYSTGSIEARLKVVKAFTVCLPMRMSCLSTFSDPCDGVFSGIDTLYSVSGLDPGEKSARKSALKSRKPRPPKAEVLFLHNANSISITFVGQHPLVWSQAPGQGSSSISIAIAAGNRYHLDPNHWNNPITQAILGKKAGVFEYAMAW